MSTRVGLNKKSISAGNIHIPMFIYYLKHILYYSAWCSILKTFKIGM